MRRALDAAPMSPRSPQPTTCSRSAPTTPSASGGLACPDDISIVGHNDMPLVDMVQPPLTTIRISHREMGRQSADLLQQAIEQTGERARTIVLPPVLVVRGSTAAPRRS